MFKKECTNLFTESSYTMYNILRLLDITLSEEIRAIPDLNRIVCICFKNRVYPETSLKSVMLKFKEYLENLKLAVNETSRQVKDKQNCEGRVQVIYNKSGLFCFY